MKFALCASTGSVIAVRFIADLKSNPAMNEPAFTYDVFLSHSAKDKAVVPPVADLSRRSHAAEAEGRAANRLSTLNYQSSTIWRLGLGAVGGGHVPVPRPAEQGASLHSPAVRRRLHKRLPGAIPLHQLARRPQRGFPLLQRRRRPGRGGRCAQPTSEMGWRQTPLEEISGR